MMAASDILCLFGVSDNLLLATTWCNSYRNCRGKNKVGQSIANFKIVFKISSQYKQLIQDICLQQHFISTADNIIYQRYNDVVDLVNCSLWLQIRPVIHIGNSPLANAHNAVLVVFWCALGVLAWCWSLSSRIDSRVCYLSDPDMSWILSQIQSVSSPATNMVTFGS